MSVIKQYVRTHAADITDGTTSTEKKLKLDILDTENHLN